MSLVYERPKIDPEDLKEIYETMSVLVYEDMDKQYKEGKISGPTYAGTYAELMKAVVSGAITATASILNKETAHDRCLKEEQCASSKSKTENETCIALATCNKSKAEENLLNAKEKAEDIKNGALIVPNSLYGRNIAVADAQEKLYIRQKNGFDENANQKYLDSITGPYSILFQDLDLDSNSLPHAFTGDGVDEAVARITDGLDNQ